MCHTNKARLCTVVATSSHTFYLCFIALSWLKQFFKNTCTEMEICSFDFEIIFYTRIRNKRTATYIKFLDFFPGVRKFNSFFFFETIFMAVWSLRGWKGTSIVFTFWNLELAQVNENMENMVLQTFNCVCTASRKT